MEIFTSIILLIVATMVANIIYSFFPKIQLIFYEILTGLGLSLLPIFHNYTLYPEIFMMVIIAPLLFNDGQNTKTSDLRKMVPHLLSMAVYLVAVSSVIIGFASHAIMASIPVALCFALTAIVIPTDSLALGSITGGFKMPADVASVLSNESLFNDASGLVMFNLALVYFTTGNFSFAKGLENFGISFLGGIIFGLIAGGLLVRLQTILINQSADTSSVIVPISVLTPIAIYLIAEQFDFSGILAAVSAGILYGGNQSRLRLTSTNVQLIVKGAWEIVDSLLNGIVFVLLGITLPTVINHIISLSATRILKLIGLAVFIYLGMFAIRFIWTRMNFVQLKSNRARPTNRESFLVAIGGIHGTITLAMALSLPLTLHGSPFPLRNQLIFMAAIIILLSLLLPTFILPFVLGKKEIPDTDTFDQYRIKMVDAAVNKLKMDLSISPTDQNYVMDMLNTQKKNTPTDHKEIKRLVQKTREISEQTIIELLNENQIPQQYANMVARRTIQRSRNNVNLWHRLSFWGNIHFSKRRFHRKHKAKIEQFKRQREQFQRGNGDKPDLVKPIDSDSHPKTELTPTHQQQYATQYEQKVTESIRLRKLITDRSSKDINNYLDEIETPENTGSVAYVRSRYNRRVSEHQQEDANADSVAQRNQLLILAFQTEYSFVANLYKQTKIDKSLSDKLNSSISTDQMVYLQSVDED